MNSLSGATLVGLHHSGAIPASLRTRENEAILDWLNRAAPSAHSDLVEELEIACGTLEGVEYFCPDPRVYAWTVAYAPSSRIFAVAIGMSEIWLRVPRESLPSALEEGATTVEELCDERDAWIRRRMFSGTSTFYLEQARLAAYARIAYDASRFGMDP